MTSSSLSRGLSTALGRIRGAWLVLTGGVWEPSTPNATPGEVVVHRLSQQSMALLEKRLPKPMLGGTGTNDPIYAGYMLGVQRVLTDLREGFGR